MKFLYLFFNLHGKIIHYSVRISFNVNHTVDSDVEPEIETTDDKPDVGEMKSKPNFEIDIKRGNQTLSFTCSFNNEPGSSGANESYSMYIFIIDVIFFSLPKC